MTPAMDPSQSEPLREHCAATLVRLVDDVAARGQQFRGGLEVEPLHKLRVGTRRLRALLSFYEPAFAGSVVLVEAQGALRKLARPFGELRDVDVFLVHLDERVAALDPKAVAALRKTLTKRRGRLAAEVADVVGSGKWRHRLEAIREEALAGAWREGTAAEVPAREFGVARLDLWWWALLSVSEGLAELEMRPRHRVRIEAKRLRYATEETAALFPEAAAAREEFTAGLVAIQESLGELNDSAVARELLARAGLDAPPADPAATRDALARAVAARDALAARGAYWRG